ncbi:MAG: hypothetical protein LLG15_06960 [Betaproteobacteria bacterium]|nr:hypothetical protein [Betaproteobacteria bacterium]
MSNPPIDANFADVRDLFFRRTEEVLRYFEFLTAVTDNKANLLGVLQPDQSMTKVENFVLSRDLVKTLRANGYLLLYNLVESTMTNAIDGIHQIFHSGNLSFDDLRAEVQQVILKDFRAASLDVNMISNRSHPIQIAMLRMGYNKMSLFSGNVDARSIRDTAKIYGFDIAEHDTSVSRDGRRLLNVKEKRNQLAHGKISFEDCGHETSHDELIAIANETIAYLKAVLGGIEAYVTQRAYLANLRNAS